jgi:hypothetical protein
MTHLTSAINDLPRLLGYVRIDGCLVEQTKTGLKWGGKEFATVDELRKYWVEHEKRVENTINKRT